MANPDIADQASAGGKARAASLPKVRRVEIARRAAKARWGRKRKTKAAGVRELTVPSWIVRDMVRLYFETPKTPCAPYCLACLAANVDPVTHEPLPPEPPPKRRSRWGKKQKRKAAA
jgi:hypothetical protein